MMITQQIFVKLQYLMILHDAIKHYTTKLYIDWYCLVSPKLRILLVNLISSQYKINLQITKRYEEKQGGQANDLSIGLLEGLIGQLQIQAPQTA